ncbi:TKL protein kinase [Fonticula alba]|uniref:TKL protein kinase n=1 Tax=Fonticula alba TaxID=691883 RepID=A0A058Z2G8_FONAL|nr:TKL protein kinase [Fonticula alba]KCV68123.1 TKL protein kinase [Fonticula alba]|eukprot:XP_009497497.1 TKL protein kinase [Fonticula alba]
MTHGRAAQLPTRLHVLATLEAHPGPVHYRAVNLLIHANWPGALVLATGTTLLLAPLYCPTRASSQLCFLRPASSHTLPGPWAALSDSGMVPLSLASGPAPTPGPAAAIHSTPSPERTSLLALLTTGQGPLWRLDILLEACDSSTWGMPSSCGPCHARCATCTGPGPEDCTACALLANGQPLEPPCTDTCPAGLLMTGINACTCHEKCLTCAGPLSGRFHCVECMAGFVKSTSVADVDWCLACAASCATCSAESDAGACLSCQGGLLLSGSTCVSACLAGHWPDLPSSMCRPCPEGCTACTSGTACTGCREGHFRRGGACLRCDGSCVSCQDAASCEVCRPGLVFLSADPQQASLCGGTCAPGEYVGAGRCAACHESCELCDQAAAACRVCAPGFRWGAVPGPGGTGTCVPCDPGCASCTSAACHACLPGLVLDSSNACVAACPAGSFSNGESCQPCDVSCVACAGGMGNQCTGCAAGLELVEVTPGVGTCESGCPEGQYRQGTDCLPCDAACATCNGPTDKDCWRCASGVLQGGDCVQACAARHVAMADRCLPCHVSCAECMGTRSTECLPDCAPDLLALPAGQWPMRCVPACPAGYHTSAAGCAPCGAHCASCPESNDTCALCERGWLLDAPSCVAECPPSSVAQGGLCATCHATCATCYGPEPGHCLTCGPASPLLVGGTCFEACPEGTFQVASACQPCDGSCAACAGPSGTDCTRCPGDRALLSSGACAASCLPGEYPAGDPGGGAGRVCARCDGSCATCSGPSAAECTACPPGRLLLLPDHTCVSTCPAGHLACDATRECEACPAGCTHCQGDASCRAMCTACEDGLLLSGMACAAICPAGHFAPAGSRICEPCDGACNTCTERPDRCTSCAAGFLLPAEGACAGACPAGSAPLSTPDRVCLACPADCEQCTAAGGQAGCTVNDDGSLACPSVGSCSRCAAHFLLLHGASCVGSCPVGMYDGWEASPAACLACRAGCAECTGPEEADCVRSAGPSSRGLALGLGIGLGLLMLLLLLVALLVLLWRYRRAAKSGGMDRMDDEDATVMNTIVELSLPGSILVSIANDFAPLNEDALGAGTQASVYAARAVGAGISDRLGCPGTVAIKQLKAERMTPTQVTLFQNEVALMWLLRDAPNIVRLYGYSDQPPAMVMERYHTDLATLLHSEVPLAPHVLLDIVQQWATGLEAMHAQGIAHRDLKPGNVFVSQRPDGAWTAALGDLGTTRNLNTDRSSTLVSQAPELNALTARYAAPEVLAAFQRKRPLDPELLLPADIYSAAIMLWECLTRTVPWKALNFEQIATGVLSGDRPSAPAAFEALDDLLTLAWAANPHARPLAASLRQKSAMLAVLSGPGP